MRIQQEPVHCTTCKHDWLADMVLDAPVKVFVAAMRELRCPKCGGGVKKVAFGRGDVPNPKPVTRDMTDDQRRSLWLLDHDSGQSSKCIADMMCGSPASGDYPHDGSDFGRCERLLMRYPEWRARLPEMVEVNEAWTALVAQWDGITEAWRADEETREARKKGPWRCYDLMRSILDPIEAKDRRIVRLGGGVSIRFGP